MIEHQIRFAIPPDVAAQLRDDIEAQVGDCDESVMSARYFDTSTGDLAQQGVSLHLRRESNQWIQTWSSLSSNGFTRVEHHLPLSHGALQVAHFLGREGTESVMQSKEDASQIQDALRARYQIVFERVRGVLVSESTGGQSTIEMTLDAGEIRARSKNCPVLELNFELLGGDLAPMLEVAASWQARYGLTVLPVSKAELGDRLARRKRLFSVYSSRSPLVSRQASVARAGGQIIDECLNLIARNAIAINRPESTVQHLVHCHEGLRHLDAAVRLFKSSAAPLPGDIQARITDLRRQFGRARNDRLLRHEILPQLYAAGCGPLGPAVSQVGVALDDRVGQPIQQLLISVLLWRHQQWSPQSASDPFSRLARQRLNRRLRRLRKRAKGFEVASIGHRRRLLNQLIKLRIEADFARSVIGKKRYRKVDDLLNATLPPLMAWCDLQQAGRLLQAEKLASNDRTAFSFAAGWVAGRTDALESQLTYQIGRLKDQKF